jgi:replicative DNA helicase
VIAEKALLGTFLKDSHLIQDSNIRPEHFGQAQHQSLMKLIKKLASEGKEIDPVTLSLYGDPANFGGVSYLNDLLTHANPVKVDEYEELVTEGWKEREKRNILTIAATEDWDIQRVIGSLDAINEIKVNDHKSISEQLAEVYEAPWTKQEKKKGVPTGVKRLDLVTNGWQNGEVTIIAARPSMGKSDVMLHLAKHAGWHEYLPLLFSLEMPAESLTSRLIASTGRYNRSKMRDPYTDLTPKQKETWSDTLGVLEKTKIQIFDQAGQTIPVMRAKVRKMMHQFPDRKPIIIIDYLGLIKPNEFYGGSANAQITEISKNLKAMAKDFECPVICLAQLNRSVEQRQDKRPMMSDIRDSGSVEQDADVIMFLYREKYYNKESDDNTLELIIAKNRNGPVGTIKTLYNEHTGVIEDYNGS